MRTYMVVTIVLATAAPLQARGVALETRIQKEQRIAAADGSIELRMVPATKAAPGDRLRYMLRYRNEGEQPARDVTIAQPIATGILYQGPADGFPAPEVSTDGSSFGPLSTLTVPAGAGPARPATAADVTHVRWRIPAPIAPGAGGAVAFRAVLK